MSEYADGLKKVTLDGKSNFFIWTTQLLGSADSYSCQQVVIVVPKESDVLYETKDANKKFLLARKMNSPVMILLCLSMTENFSKLALCNGRTTYPPSGDAAKVKK
jgi:hypothetical protein